MDTPETSVLESTQKSDNFFKELVEASEDLIWQCDDAGCYVYLNPAWEKMFGYSVEEMLGRKFTEFQPLEQAEKDMPIFRDVLKGTEVKQYETVHLRKDGKPVHLVFNATFVRDGNGHICGTHGSAHDITPIKIAEKALRESKTRHEQILTNSFDCAVLLDEKGIQTYVSKSVSKMLGFQPEELIGLSIIEKMLHPYDQAGVKDAFQRVINCEEPVTVQYRHQHKNGSWIWLEARATNQLKNPAIKRCCRHNP